MAFTLGKLTEIKSHFITYKSNENTSYLNTKLIKTVTVNVHKSDGNRKYSYEMANVVKDSGEGRCFLQLGDAMGAAKNVVLEPLASALGERLFYIMLLQCIRDFDQQQDSSLCTIMPHYVTKLWEKKITGMSCEAYVFLFCALGKLFG